MRRNPDRAHRIGATARREGTTPRQVRRRRKAQRRAAKRVRDAVVAELDTFTREQLAAMEKRQR